MPKASQLTFNGGEVTEFIDPRADVAKYAKSCREMENFSPLPFGSALCAAGTEHVTTVKDSTKKTRIIPFNFAKTEELLEIEVGDLYFRFFLSQVPVMSGGSPYEISSPYLEADLFKLQFTQQNDFVWITHPDYKTRQLIRNANDSWVLQEIDFSVAPNYPPLAPYNETDTTLAVSGSYGELGDAPTLTASASLFTASSVGDLYAITHIRSEVQQRQEYTVDASSAPFYVFGDWVFETGGSGVYDIILEETFTPSDSGSWKEIRKYDIDGSVRNERTTGTAVSPRYFRATISNLMTPGTGANVLHTIIEVSTPSVTGLLKVTGYTSATVVTAEVVEPLLSSDATKDWQTEYFNETRGFARTACFHKDRFCMGSEDIWLSQPGNYSNFRTRNDVDSGFMVPVRRNGAPLVQWLESLRDLRVGTNQAEGVIIQENTSEAFGYDNFDLRWDTNYGSSYHKAQAVNGTVLYLQQEARTLRNQIITGIEDYYDSDSETLYADHILEGGVSQMAYQRQRYSTLHAARQDGQLASMLYEPNQNIKSWFRRTTDGEIESIAVNPRADEEDQICLIVKRTKNGATVRNVEYVKLGQYRNLKDSNKSEMWFVDDGIRIAGSGMTTLTGLDHLEGETVAILCDGAPIPERAVSGGSVDLDYATDVAIVGRPYDYTLSPMYLDSPSTMGQTKRITGVIVKQWRSGRFWVKVDDGEENLHSITTTETDEAPDLQNGDTEKISVGGGWSRNTTITIRGRSPVPLNVQSVTLEYDIANK